MTIQSQIKKPVEKLRVTRVYRFLPRGIDLSQDISNHLPALHLDVLFDVGANIGQSAMKFLSWFPNSHIYCFEPVGDTFRKLQENLKGNDHFDSFQLALGAYRGKGKMLLQGASDMFSLLNLSKDVMVNDGSNVEEIDLETLDGFCHDRTIDKINYLKIDTEGSDLEVLKGAENMLSAHRIDLVEVEAGMNCRNKRHVPFEILKEFLESKKYFLFGIYEQVHEWPTKEPHLRRINPVFVSEPVIKANSGMHPYHPTGALLVVGAPDTGRSASASMRPGGERQAPSMD